MFGFLSGKHTATMNGNGRAGGVHAGRPALGADILRGGHGKAFLEDEGRVAHERLAEKKLSIEQALPDLQRVAQFQCDEELAVIGSVTARMDRIGRSAVSKIGDRIGRMGKYFTALFREFSDEKGLLRPVQQAEPVVNTFALFLVFFVTETCANSTIFYGLGRFGSAHDAVIFSGTLALTNLGLAWTVGFLSLRNWNHTSERVKGLSRISLVPLALGWIALHGMAVFMRLSENLDFENVHLSDIEVTDYFSSLMLVLIAVLTTVVCTYKSYKKMGDTDAQVGDMHKLCIEDQQEAAESEADARQDELDECIKEARQLSKELGAKLEQEEGALNKGKVAWEQGNRDLAVLAEQLKRGFLVEIAKTSTKDNFRWSAAGPKHAGLEFSPDETKVEWDQAAEVRARASLTRARERLTQARDAVEKSYAEASEGIEASMQGLQKIHYFVPEGQSS